MPKTIDMTPDSDDEKDNKEDTESKSKAIEGAKRQRKLKRLLRAD